MLEKSVLRKIFGPKRQEIARGYDDARNLHQKRTYGETKD
jgi:hypothetical protein